VKPRLEHVFTRREWLGASTLVTAAAAQGPAAPTEFQIACMTLPYAAFSFERALQGIAKVGYKYVAWGVTHRNSSGQTAEVLPVDAPPSAARELADRSRNLGLEPVMMFANVQMEAPESANAHARRIKQAAAAKVPFILTFGNTKGGPYDTWIRNLKQLGPMARDAGVTIVIKQHGGNSGTGKLCAKIIRDVADDGVRMFYDAGNNLWYNNDDPISDIQTCREYIRGFAVKDLRLTPKREGCGPGLGEIDHYKLLLPVARTGLKMPLACETLWAPLLPRPAAPEDLDALARRAREFLELVTTGLQA
jgi:sugar phosphate isomerase/epimerase